MLPLVLLWPAAAVGQGKPKPQYRSVHGIAMRLRPVPKYRHDVLQTSAVLVVPYASPVIVNPADWDTTRKERVPTQVDVVYTGYPRDTADWLTPYGRLMTQRVENLLAHDPRLANPEVVWNLVPQTAPATDAEARTFFHGFVIQYRIDLELGDPGFEAVQEKHYETVKRMVGGDGPFGDSTVFRVFARQPHWREMLVVLDWTGSMYPFGAQALRWAQLPENQRRMRHLVVFNDGDDFQRRQPGRRGNPKPVGRTGGYYVADPEDLADVLATVKIAMLRGDGAEPPENNLEVLLHATRKLFGYGDVVMVADNSSAVRDMVLLPYLRQPVRIILCGTFLRETHADYLTIAWATGGSVHTITDDLDFAAPKAPVGPEGVSIGGETFVLSGGRFIPRPSGLGAGATAE